MKTQYLRPKKIPYPKGNEYSTARFELGRQLFFDTRLSGPGTMSCASCHNPDLAWGDGLPTGIGSASNRLDRRSPTLLNLAWAQLLFWDGRADTLEEQAVGPIQNPNEMTNTIPHLVDQLHDVPSYRAQFAKAYPNEPISGATIGKAIATFERSIVSAQGPFDRWIEGDEGAIGDAAKRGFITFNTKGHCSACHSTWRFTDDSFHDIGLKDGDIGRGKLVDGVEILRHAFKVPGLRNVAQRAPYMHNGSLPTLDAVIRHYNDGFVYRPSKSVEIHPLNLTNPEIQDLVAFLEALTSADPKVSVPTPIN
jgi:cytochrome c peroxidase